MSDSQRQGIVDDDNNTTLGSINITHMPMSG
jgi:hypothetical protein